MGPNGMITSSTALRFVQGVPVRGLVVEVCPFQEQSSCMCQSLEKFTRCLRMVQTFCAYQP